VPLRMRSRIGASMTVRFGVKYAGGWREAFDGKDAALFWGQFYARGFFSVYSYEVMS